MIRFTGICVLPSVHRSSRQGYFERINVNSNTPEMRLRIHILLWALCHQELLQKVSADVL